MKYEEALDFLFTSLPVFENTGAGAYKPGLERMLEFAAVLGDPQKRIPAVHVAGTNGKGSTSHMLASVLHAAGYRTGLYTSPHLTDFRERIRVDGEMIPREAVVEFTERNRETMVTIGLSFFEMATAMAFDWFARGKVDIAVIETGLGGRLDATNIINPILSIITNIGIEHTQYLGDTIPDIAAEKAGIIKPGVPVVIGETDPKSAPVFEARAAELSSPIIFADQVPDSRSYQLDLEGEYQRKNLRTVLAGVNEINRAGRFFVPESALERGLRRAAASTGLKGRWQVVGQNPLVVLDTAHNAHGMQQAMAQLSCQKYRDLYMVLGFAADKDLDAIIPLLPENAHHILTQASVGRAMPAGELQRIFRSHGIATESVVPVSEAICRAVSMASDGDMIYIGGSNFTVAEALPMFDIPPAPESSSHI